MKKQLLAFALVFIFIATARAAVHRISTSNFQFSPSTVNAIVGDTVKWVWLEGFHTTTSKSIPTGATTWNHDLKVATDSFTYVLTVAGTYNYWCAIHTTNMQGVLNVTGSLPVTLAGFDVVATSDSRALLNWKTLTEQNTEYFSVRKSYDGNSFTEIAKVTAAGNSSTQKNYSYIDGSVGKTSKYIYYMIAITDKDGSEQFTDIKMFKNNTAVSKLIMQLSPNPVGSSDHLMLQFNADKPGKMLVQLYDLNGKLSAQTEMTAVTGLNNGHFHMMGVAAGSYNIVFVLNDIKETYRILVK